MISIANFLSDNNTIDYTPKILSIFILLAYQYPSDSMSILKERLLSQGIIENPDTSYFELLVTLTCDDYDYRYYEKKQFKLVQKDPIINEITPKISQDNTTIHYLYFMAYKEDNSIGMPFVFIIYYTQNELVIGLKGIGIKNNDEMSYSNNVNFKKENLNQENRNTDLKTDLKTYLRAFLMRLENTWKFKSIELIYRNETPIIQSGGYDDKLSIDPKEIKEQTKLLIDYDSYDNTFDVSKITNFETLDDELAELAEQSTPAKNTRASKRKAENDAPGSTETREAGVTPPPTPIPATTTPPAAPVEPAGVSPAVITRPLLETNLKGHLRGSGGRKTRKNKKRKTKTIKNKNKNRNRKTKTRKNRNRNRNKNRKTKTRKNKKRKPKSRKNRQSK